MRDNEWKFVSVGSAGQPKNVNDRKVIRKAAMRDFRRRERIERIQAFAAECAAEAEAKAAACLASSSGQPPCVSTKAEDSGQSGTIVLLTKPYCPTGYDAWPERNIISDGQVLPPSAAHCQLINILCPLEIPRDLGYLKVVSCRDPPDIGYLFDYFISEIIPIMMPFEGHNQRLLRIYWGKNLVKDRVVLQAALSHAAVHMDTVNRREPSKQAIMHTKHAIRLINQRLGSKPFIVDNEFIAAVAMIACNSNLTGDLAESRIHMNALQELVRLKGGKDNLGCDKFIHALLSWQVIKAAFPMPSVNSFRSDATSARMARSKPRFPSSLTISPDFACSLSAVLPPIPHIEEVFGLIGELRKLTDLKRSLDNSITSTIDDIMAFDAQRNALEERTLRLQYTYLTTHGLGFGDIFLDACCMAASIYINLVFRKFDASLPNLRTTKHDLMAVISNAETSYASLGDLPESNFPYAESLLWVLFVGGSLALDPSETTWFANRLMLVVPWTQVRSWNEAEACLQGVLWVDKLHNEACASLWHETENILGFKDTGELRLLEDGLDPQRLALQLGDLD